MQIEIDEELLQDIINIETGVFSPLHGFMNEEDFRSVVDKYTLADGEVFTVPITMDVSEDRYRQISVGDKVELFFCNETVAGMDVESKFIVNSDDIIRVFCTSSNKHPGVNKERKRSKCRIGGRTYLYKKELLNGALNPSETKSIFSNRGWKTIAGFQTRNPVHKAHEYIQRLALETCDGLLINPITGWKKKGDFTEEAVMAAYQTMIERFYPNSRVYLVGLKTQMRYAGPREAIFHAIIRRNLGCTHFTIGRDHAGVGGFYGAYDAHELARRIIAKHDIGITLMLTREPYYCDKCGQIVTDNTCGHYYTNRFEISGTIVRKYISEGYMPNEMMMRQEILDSILACEKVFI